VKFGKLEGTLVEAFFLDPVNRGSAGLIEMVFELVYWEGCNLLNLNHLHSVSSSEILLLEHCFDVESNLTRAKHDFGWFSLTVALCDQGFEARASFKLFNMTDSSRMFESDFGRCDDQRLPKVTMHLASKNVEVVGRS